MYVIDSGNLSTGMGHVVLAAAKGIEAGLPVEQIARRHGRTAGAIEARLSELGRRDQIQFNMR